MLLKACLNGVRSTADHPALPTRPHALGVAAAEAASAGAEAVHLHVKDALGQDTLDPDSTAAALRAVRLAAPDTPVGVTTGAWILPEPGDRIAAIQQWSVLPDFASVNWHERGADAVAAALLARGVGVEAGLWHDDAVAAWSVSPARDSCLRLLIELPDGLDAADATGMADRLLATIYSATEDTPSVVLHGEGSTTWPALRHAAKLGLIARIGLEDTLELPDGAEARDNAQLIRVALQLISTIQTA